MKNFLIAIGFLTKIPMPKKLGMDDKNLSNSMAYFPLVGFFIGLILIIINAILIPLLPVRLVNLILVLFLIVVTGAIHLDGFADTLDGFCAKGKSRKEILEIMRDSRIGVMGVIGLVLLILFKYEMLNTIPAQLKGAALILMCSVSRWCQVLVSYFSIYGREGEGLGKSFIGNIRKRVFYSAAVSAILISILAWFIKGLVILFLISAFARVLMKYIHGRIGGMTGDTVGAVNELTELFVLFGIYILGRI